MRTALEPVYRWEDKDFPLLARLREFHVEMLRIRAALSSGGWPTGEGEEIPDIVLRVHYRLRGVLERQGSAATRESGSYGAGLYRDAQYVMAALADEILLHLIDWEGRGRWRDHLLEMALFQSQVAGERIFDRLDKMLSARANTDPDLAAVYLVALLLGFRGKYRGFDDGGALRDYRQRLRALIRSGAPRSRAAAVPGRLCVYDQRGRAGAAAAHKALDGGARAGRSRLSDYPGRCLALHQGADRRNRVPPLTAIMQR
jgi:type IV/VI secretion system ImpK/VasF family protein